MTACMLRAVHCMHAYPVRLYNFGQQRLEQHMSLLMIPQHCSFVAAQPLLKNIRLHDHTTVKFDTLFSAKLLEIAAVQWLPSQLCILEAYFAKFCKLCLKTRFSKMSNDIWDLKVEISDDIWDQLDCKCHHCPTHSCWLNM